MSHSNTPAPEISVANCRRPWLARRPCTVSCNSDERPWAMASAKCIRRPSATMARLLTTNTAQDTRVAVASGPSGNQASSAQPTASIIVSKADASPPKRTANTTAMKKVAKATRSPTHGSRLQRSSPAARVATSATTSALK